MRRKPIKIIIVTAVITVFFLLIFPFPKKQNSSLNKSPSVKGVQSPVKISARVGEHTLTLSGWTSPQAIVFLSSSLGNLSAQTTADKTGFFIFRSIPSPNQIGELSLIAQDTGGLSSPPLFLPQPTNWVNQDLSVENVLLPPTLGLAQGELKPNQTYSAFGKSFPNSEVLIYLYSDSKTSLWKGIREIVIKIASAKTPPILKVESNDEGDFEFNLPSVKPAEQKIFVASLFSQNYSPKSFTLSFKTLSSWEQIAAVLVLLLEKIYLWFRTIS